ncbi:MAG: nucleotide sugar dehydrogenase, partial [Salinibacter sp.]
ERMGINVWEVVDAAKTKPFGFMPFYPSPGVGGHCIPIDPFFLAWKAQEYDFSTRFIRVAGEINDRMPEYVVDRITDVLNRHKQCLNGAKVLLVGMSYKQDTNDLRHAPAVKVASLLKQREADAFYHDPYVPCCQVNGETLYSTLLERDTLNESNIVVITTDHSGIDYELIADHAPLVYDTRNALKDYRDRPHVFQLGGVGPYSHG